MAYPKLTLYRKDGACSLIPHILLTYLGIPFTAVEMAAGPDGYEGKDGTLTRAEYLRINPNGYVPTLVVDGVVVTEMPAVLTYIASLALERKLLGESAMDRTKVVEWMAWLSGTLHSLGFAAFWRPNRFTDDVKAHEGIKRRGREVIEKSYARIEERLNGREVAVGEGITVVDFNLYVFWRWGEKIGVEMGDLYPNYGRVMRKVERLEGVTDAARREGLDACFGD